MKDAKPLFVSAAARSEAMIVDRILVRLLPDLMRHGMRLTWADIEAAEALPLPDDLYRRVQAVTEELTGLSFQEPAGGVTHV